MRIECEYTQLVDLHKLQANPKNPNKHPDKQIKRLSQIIDYQGMRSPIVVSKRSGFITKGHGRLEALKKLNWSQAPVDYQDYEDEAQEYADMVADNAIAEWAAQDLSEINLEMIELGPDFDVDMLGIENFTIEPIEKYDEATQDDVPEVKHDPITKRGDVWLLGEHRVMCGDSTMIDDVDKLMIGENADITFTSPPYNIGKSIRGNMYKKNSDDFDDDEYLEFLSEWTNIALSKSTIVFHNNQLLEGNKDPIIQYQYIYRKQLKDIFVWNKSQWPPHINKGTFGSKWEYVFALSNDSSNKAFPCEWQGKYSNVIETENNSGNEYAKDHKAGFPVAFPEWIISKMDFAQSCYEPFCGTGTTLIVCEKHGLKCYGMELDEHYCDIIVERWQKYTGKQATLESTGKTYASTKKGN